MGIVAAAGMRNPENFHKTVNTVLKICLAFLEALLRVLESKKPWLSSGSSSSGGSSIDRSRSTSLPTSMPRFEPSSLLLVSLKNFSCQRRCQ